MGFMAQNPSQPNQQHSTSINFNFAALGVLQDVDYKQAMALPNFVAGKHERIPQMDLNAVTRVLQLMVKHGFKTFREFNEHQRRTQGMLREMQMIYARLLKLQHDYTESKAKADEIDQHLMHINSVRDNGYFDFINLLFKEDFVDADSSETDLAQAARLVVEARSKKRSKLKRSDAIVLLADLAEQPSAKRPRHAHMDDEKHNQDDSTDEEPALEAIATADYDSVDEELYDSESPRLERTSTMDQLADEFSNIVP